ncbi:MAG: DNA-directed RNA polymerase subunit alpha [Candidatus Improbicoccus devescovinae]|nr:MAG: DNA-directed RNA polymerase subunit alpha [Candidatus Improbicoccus devescovinae]
MIGIERPVVKELESSQDGTYGKFVIEPLERGFGNTVGNSLRRVLLSKLPGVAPNVIKINEVTHEFSAIPGVKQDVTEIVLNIKCLLAKLENCDSKTVVLDVVGPVDATAAMLEHDSEIKILNPELFIATVDEGVNLRIEIGFGRGVGYISAEQNRAMMPDLAIGVIPIDSIFTPVLTSNYVVENTRVGQVTDYESLTLELRTNGVLLAREAMALAAAELIECFKLFLNLDERVDLTNLAAKQNEKVVDVDFDISIDDMELSVRAYNSLKRAGLRTLRELAVMSKEDIAKIRNLGKKSFDEVVSKMEGWGYIFEGDEQVPAVYSPVVKRVE